MRNDIRGRALWVVLGCSIAQMGLGTNYAMAVLVPGILTEFEWSRGDFMAVTSPRVIVAALASPLIGALTYRFGARPILLCTIVAIGALFILHSSLQSLTHVFLLSIGIGFMVAGVGDISVGTVVSQWIARGRGLALGIVYSGSNLGGMIFALVATQLLLVSGWRGAYWWIGVGAVAVLFPAVFFTVRDPGAGEGPGDASDSIDAATDPGLGVTLGEAMRSSSFWLLGGALFLFYFYYLGVNAHLVLFLTDIGMSTWQASASFGFTVFLGVGAKVGIGLVADRWPAKTALLINFAVVLLASIVLLGIPLQGMLPVFVISHGLSTAAQNVVYPLTIAWCFGTKHMAQIYGVLMLALLPGGTLGPIFAGYMFEAFGNYDIAFSIFAALNVVCFGALCAVKRLQPPALS